MILLFVLYGLGFIVSALVVKYGIPENFGYQVNRYDNGTPILVALFAWPLLWSMIGIVLGLKGILKFIGVHNF